MRKTRTSQQKFSLFFKGLVMGGANKVPGVSGGMVAFIFGFYEELIFTFQRINSKAFKLFFKGRFKSFTLYTNLSFLSLVMLGSIFSYFTISLVLDYFLKNHQNYVWAWFFGLIIGSIFYISKNFKEWNLKTLFTLLLGISTGIAISFLEPAKENDNLWFVFFCGIVGISGMTLPGLSGSFILILLGNYVLLLVDSINVFSSIIIGLVRGDFTVLTDPIKIHYLKIISVFTLGSAFGLVSISHVLGYVLKKWNHIVTALIIGFITGSLGIVWPWKKTIYKTKGNIFLQDIKGNKIVENYERFFPNLSSSETWISLGFILFGITIVLGIDYYERHVKNKRIFGLLGHNISYSFSRNYFTQKFKKLGLNTCEYVNFDIQSINKFSEILKKNKGNLEGINVTTPYKQEILKHIDTIDKKAQEIGAINTLKISKNGKLKGYNTDEYGFRNSLQPLLQKHHKNALILGTGGASKAIAYTLKELGITYIFVSRTKSENSLLYAQINKKTIEDHQIIINCTPLGTSPNIKLCPEIPYDYLTEKHLLYDLIYNPSETLFLQRGRKQGTVIKNGLEMLELQAEKSWEIWNS